MGSRRDSLVSPLIPSDPSHPFQPLAWRADEIPSDSLRLLRIPSDPFGSLRIPFGHSQDGGPSGFGAGAAAIVHADLDSAVKAVEDALLEHVHNLAQVRVPFRIPPRFLSGSQPPRFPPDSFRSHF